MAAITNVFAGTIKDIIDGTIETVYSYVYYNEETINENGYFRSVYGYSKSGEWIITEFGYLYEDNILRAIYGHGMATAWQQMHSQRKY